MKRNDKGIATPLNISPLPWKSDNGFEAAIIDDGGGFVAIDATRDDAEFIAHAANYHARLVRAVMDNVELCDRWNESNDIGELSEINRKGAELREAMRELLIEMSRDQ